MDILEGEIIKFFHCYNANLFSEIFSSIFNKESNVHSQNTRSSGMLYIPKTRTAQYGKLTLQFNGSIIWNSFINDVLIKNSPKVNSFHNLKVLLKKHFLSSYESD